MTVDPTTQFNIADNFSAFTGRVDKSEYAQQGIGELKKMAIKYKPYGAGPFISGLLTNIKSQRAKMNDDASAKAADEAIKAINDAK